MGAFGRKHRESEAEEKLDKTWKGFRQKRLVHPLKTMRQDVEASSLCSSSSGSSLESCL